jgi:hypothetical protein
MCLMRSPLGRAQSIEPAAQLRDCCGSLRRHAVPRDVQFCFWAHICCFELETWQLPDVCHYN